MTRAFVFTTMLVMVGAVAGACGPPKTVIVTPQQPQQPGAKVLFEDDFSAYNPVWRQIRGQWAVQNGSMMQLRDDPREANAITFVDSVLVSNAEIRTRVTTGGTMPQFIPGTPEDQDMIRTKRFIAGAGVVFRFVDDNNYYMFRLAGEEGAVLGKMKGGQWYDLANPRSADFGSGRIQQGTEYELRVRVQGDRIQSWVNDRAVVNLTDQDFATGRVGLVVFRAQAAFAAIRVTDVN